MFVQNHFVYYDFISTYGLEKMLTSYIASHHSWVSLQKCIRQIQVSIMRLRVIMSTFFKSTVFYMGHSISWKYVTSTKFDSRINQINYLKKPILIKFQALEVPLSFNYTKKINHWKQSPAKNCGQAINNNKCSDSKGWMSLLSLFSFFQMKRKWQ